jgi:hypothetical protein
MADLDRIGSGILEFRFILRQLDRGRLDWAFHRSAHTMQRVPEYRFDGALMQRDLWCSQILAFRVMNCKGTDHERISGSRRRDVWYSSGAFDPTIWPRIVEGLSEYEPRRTYVGYSTPRPLGTGCL